eukprot:TRINITY_DN2027_c0_g1_i1.p1 TRINITY_DN2027_c0_g1~~TRINITY_DN2027_c0_g1_i1.p1  ORF type:complete len:384 (+),score=29.69 TRINITY_DN2027_c0_g1_i1:641-1792(+)
MAEPKIADAMGSEDTQAEANRSRKSSRGRKLTPQEVQVDRDVELAIRRSMLPQFNRPNPNRPVPKKQTPKPRRAARPPTWQTADMVDGFRIESYECTMQHRQFIEDKLEQYWHVDESGEVYYSTDDAKKPPLALAQESAQVRSHRKDHTPKPSRAKPEHHPRIQKEVKSPIHPSCKRRKMRLPGYQSPTLTYSDLSEDQQKVARYTSILRNMECSADFAAKRIKLSLRANGIENQFPEAARQAGTNLSDFGPNGTQNPYGSPPPQLQGARDFDPGAVHFRFPSGEQPWLSPGRSSSQMAQLLMNQRMGWSRPGWSVAALPRMPPPQQISVNPAAAHFVAGQRFPAYAAAAMPSWSPSPSWAQQLTGPGARLLQVYNQQRYCNS